MVGVQPPIQDLSDLHAPLTANEAAWLFLATISGVTLDVNFLSVLPRGCSVTRGSPGPNVSVARLWDDRGRRLVPGLAPALHKVKALAFGPGGYTLLGGTREGPIVRWDVATRALLAPLTGHTDMVTALRVSPDGTRLFSASHDMTVRVWSMPAGEEVLAMRDHEDRVTSLDLSLDGVVIVSGAANGTARLRDTRSVRDRLLPAVRRGP